MPRQRERYRWDLEAARCRTQHARSIERRNCCFRVHRGERHAQDTTHGKMHPQNDVQLKDQMVERFCFAPGFDDRKRSTQLFKKLGEVFGVSCLEPPDRLS